MSLPNAIIRLLVAASAVGSVSCAARLRSADVTGVTPGTRVDGIPFRLRANYDVTVWKRPAAGKPHAPVFQTMKSLPDMERVYVLGIDADGLAEHTLSLTIDPDGVLKVVGLQANSFKGDELLARLGDSAKLITDAVAGAEAARLAQASAEETARAALDKARDDREVAERNRTTTQLERERSALTARLDAERAIEKLETLRKKTNPTPTAEELAEQERQVVAAKGLANDKAAIAGLRSPYP